MLYLERVPHPALVPFVHTLWYSYDPLATHSRQRVLPTGRAQVVVSLACDSLTDANHPTDPRRASPPGLFLGLYSTYQHIDTIDLAELIGISFHPGGTLPFFPHSASLFSNCETDLENLWGASFRTLRDRLRDLTTPAQKFDLLESFLLDQFRRARVSALDRMVDHALKTIHAAPQIATVTALARTTGLSSRRLSQIFREHVGVSPKLYCRIQRFQKTVLQLHRGTEIPWPELALACGYYDQSHFANDFRAFSGFSPTHYTASTRPWSNHINVDD